MLHIGAAGAQHPMRRARRASVSAFTPTSLGADLLGMWDAARADLIALSGSNVTSWADTVAGVALAQATGANQPTYSATSFNGAAGVTFNGTSHYLNIESCPFAGGATPSEIWVVADQTALPADTGVRYAFNYGTNSANNARTIARSVASASNRTVARVGTGVGSAFVNSPSGSDNSGRHVMRAIFTATTVTSQLDQFNTASTAGVPNTGTARTRMGALLANTPVQFWQGQIALVAITNALSAYTASLLMGYCLGRANP